MQQLVSLVHTPDVTTYISGLGYIGIFLWIAIFSQVAFVPDELSLLTIGYLASTGVFDPIIAAVVAVLGFLFVDTIYFLITGAGRSVFGKRLAKPKTHSLRGYVTRQRRKNLPRAFFIISFIPRMRFWGPIASASVGVPAKKFFAFDTLALVVFSGVYITLGYFFGQSLSVAFDHLESMKAAIFVSVLLILGVILIFISLKVEQEEKKHG